MFFKKGTLAFAPEATGSGRVVAPGASAVLATIPASQLPAGTYDITTHASVSGAAAADTGNMALQTTAALAAPVGVAVSAVPAPGNLVSGTTYFYKVTAYNSQGETVGSAEVSAAAPATGSLNVTWTAVAGAVGYRVYRGTVTATQNTFFNVSAGGAGQVGFSPAQPGAVSATQFLDSGGAGTAGTVPVANTTNIIASPVPHGLSGIDAMNTVHGRFLDGTVGLQVIAIGAGTAAIVYDVEIEANRVG